MAAIRGASNTAWGKLVSQRVYGLALGYEDLNDHDELRRDPVLAMLAGKSDVSGQRRRRERDRGQPLAGKSTLQRLERTTDGVNRYQKVRCVSEAIDRLLVDVFVEAHSQEPAEVLLDIDATDTPLHGQQEGRFFHGYYRHYCYLPLYIFSGEHVLCARQRMSNQDAAAGSVAELERIVAQLRAAWPKVKDHPASRLGVLSGRVAELVRREQGGLCGGAGAQRAAAVVDRGGPRRGEPAAAADGPAGAGLQRVRVSDA